MLIHCFQVEIPVETEKKKELQATMKPVQEGAESHLVFCSSVG